ncbi:MAG: hypothetical protein JXA20_09650 [Spirochaetes bacterium]|nr:hypothetical protein [Spirochaetota bacterium]
MKKCVALPMLSVLIIAVSLTWSGRSYSQDSGNDLPQEYQDAPVPDKLSDREIDEIINGIGDNDTQGDQAEYGEDPQDIDEGPEMDAREREYYGRIIANPDNPGFQWRTDQWLYDHPAVAYHIFANYSWINGHRDIGLWLYARLPFIWSDPYVAFAAYGNYVFLNLNPSLTLQLYMNVDWLRRHPMVATRVYVNERFLSVYPRVVRTLYDDNAWFLSHPRVARIAYRNRGVLRGHPEIARGAYRYQHFMKRHPGFRQVYRHKERPGGQKFDRAPHHKSGSFGKRPRDIRPIDRNRRPPDFKGGSKGKTIQPDRGSGFRPGQRGGGQGKIQNRQNVVPDRKGGGSGGKGGGSGSHGGGKRR